MTWDGVTCTKCSRVGILLATFLVLGCGMESDPENLGTNSEALTGSFTLDFENEPLGPLAGAWSVTKDSPGGASTATIESTPDHGKVLHVHGVPVAPSYLVATFRFSNSLLDIDNQVDLNPSAGAAFVWTFQGSGPSPRWIRLQRAPGSTMLVASTAPSGWTNCAALSSDVWSHVAIIVHTQQVPHTFDVLINGEATACTGVHTYLTAPYTLVNVMDASNQGWGGDVLVDNISVTAP